MEEYVPVIDKSGKAIMVEVDSDDFMENKQTYILSPKKCRVCKQPKEGFVAICCNCNYPK